MILNGIIGENLKHKKGSYDLDVVRWRCKDKSLNHTTPEHIIMHIVYV